MTGQYEKKLVSIIKEHVWPRKIKWPRRDLQ